MKWDQTLKKLENTGEGLTPLANNEVNIGVEVNHRHKRVIDEVSEGPNGVAEVIQSVVTDANKIGAV
jgi:hypothetical protein